MTVTLDPANKSISVTLTNGNLTATSSSTASAVFSTTSQSSGKWFFEITTTNDSSQNNEFGTGSVTGHNVNHFLESDGGIAFVYSGSGVWDQFGGSGGTSNTYTPGASLTVSICLDIGNGKIYLIVDGTHKVWGDASAGTGGVTIVPDVAGFYVGVVPTFPPTTAQTVNFGATPFVAAIPTGYTSWDGSQTGGGGGSPAILLGQRLL